MELMEQILADETTDWQSYAKIVHRAAAGEVLPDNSAKLTAIRLKLHLTTADVAADIEIVPHRMGGPGQDG